MDVFDDIVAFHEKFGLLPKQKGFLTDDILDFRLNFFNEEITEFEEAHVDKDMEQCLDACIDAMYITLGAMVLLGFSAAEMREAWRRVHACNMAKVRAAKASDSKRGHECDVVKPQGWVAPDLSDLCK